MSEVTKPIALDESFNTTGQTPKNLADVMKNGLQEIAQAIDSHQGGGGHVILDQNGNALDQEPNMQFVDAHTSDDSVNAKTIIENIKSVTEAQFESAPEDGLYDVDIDGAEIGEISEEYIQVKGNGVKTRGDLLAEIYSQIDFDKIKENATINQNGAVFTLSSLSTNSVTFTLSAIATNKLYTSMIRIASSCAAYDSAVDGNSYTRTDDLPTVIPSGYKITLYYGNDKAVVDLQTTANRCLMSNGETVENALSPSGYSASGFSFTDCTYGDGGYFKIGNLIILNIRITVTTASSTTKNYINIPNSIKPILNIVGLTAQNVSDDSAPIYSVASSDKIYMKGTTASKIYAISGMWLV